MQHLDISVINQAHEWLEQRPVWLCTVLNTYGSSPRSPGALMVATADNRFCGSLSGGCVEEDFLQRIAQGEYQQASQIVRYGEGGLEPGIALPCGGVLDILVEYLPATPGNIMYLEKMAAALNGHFALQKRLTLPEPCRHLEVTEFADITQVERNGQQITVHVAAAPRLLIAGLSSVALYCADFASALGFEVLVCENRPDALENFAAQLKPGITLLRQFPANYLEQHSCHANTAIVALTHDPRMDDLTMMEAVNTPAFYIGAMGSQKNSARRLERLQKIAELNPTQLQRIHAPIGLPLGSKTPAEIALAVMADIVKQKNEARG
ncbi:XdhC/CoxF family xanthine dehydrogenase maturation factor [Buttiauxella noackiae ATCC 51607]|uniref:XdhC/CoxF family xanthine dehydrogenase maturation factor n=1 Tax=Buttiauxella noackiae ATCC 51607 TaxID=1354255 RepID=A0A1B7HPK1_9ENTR|nr:XdhC family protein [Buttiauxella noackiae]OAT17570.1 XdhC/CoxF family xanthine dehydrogenase maturation factor [Buttiauxella noackiae ATCC 51607]